MRVFAAWLAKVLSDGDNPSTARVLSIATVPALILVPLCVWAILSLHARAMLELPGSVTGFVSAGCTAILTHQYFSKREETKETQAAA